MSSFINTVASPKLLQMPQDMAKSTAQKGHLDGRKVTVIVFSSIALAAATAACVVAALKISLFAAAALLAAAVVASIVTLIAASKIKTSNPAEKQAHTREVEQLNQKIVELEGTVAKQKQDLEKQPTASTPAAAKIDSEQLTKLEDEVKALNKDLSEKTDELNKLKSLPDQKQQIADLGKQVKDLQESLKKKDEELNQLKADLQKAQAANRNKNSPAKPQSPRTSTTVKNLNEAALTTLRSDYDKLVKDHTAQQQSMQKLAEEKAQLEKAKQEAEKTVEKTRTEKDQIIQNLKSELENLQQTYDNLKKEHITLPIEVVTEHPLQTKDLEKEQIKKDLEEMTSKYDTFVSQAQTMIKMLNEQVEKIPSYTLEIDKLKLEIQELNKKLAATYKPQIDRLNRKLNNENLKSPEAFITYLRTFKDSLKKEEAAKFEENLANLQKKIKPQVSFDQNTVIKEDESSYKEEINRLKLKVTELATELSRLLPEALVDLNKKSQKIFEPVFTEITTLIDTSK